MFCSYHLARYGERSSQATTPDFSKRPRSSGQIMYRHAMKTPSHDLKDVVMRRSTQRAPASDRQARWSNELLLRTAELVEHMLVQAVDAPGVLQS